MGQHDSGPCAARGAEAPEVLATLMPIPRGEADPRHVGQVVEAATRCLPRLRIWPCGGASAILAAQAFVRWRSPRWTARLWDLKARLLDVPLVKLLGQVRDAVPIYGSGGFTSYSNQQLAAQLSAWVEAGNSSSQDEDRPRTPTKTSSGLESLATRLGRDRSCSSMPTALTAASKRCRRRKCLASMACAGLRSRFLPTISMVCA